MTAPDGSSGESASAFELDVAIPDVPPSTLFAFPGSLTGGAAARIRVVVANDAIDPPADDRPADEDGAADDACAEADDPTDRGLPTAVAEALDALAAERGVPPEALLGAAALLTGAPDTAEGRIAAAESALALAGRGDHAVIARRDIDRLESRIELLEYRGKALTNALERVSFQPLDGGIRDVRDAAQLFGFANEWCFDEDRVRRRFRELAPVYHPDTGVVADRERMTQLIEARNLLVHHVRTAYASGAWADQRRR